MPEEYVELRDLERLVRDNPCITPTQLLQLAKSKAQFMCCGVSFEDVDEVLDEDENLPIEQKIEVLMHYSKDFDWLPAHEALRTAIVEIQTQHSGGIC